MILDDLQNADRYVALHPAFAAAFAYLRSTDLAKLSPGRHEIEGDRLFVIAGEDPGRGRTGARLEAHRRYIDIQYVISGDEEMGWRALADCHSLTDPYSETRDIEFYSDAPASWFAVPPGMFVVFFPNDVHAPLAGSGTLRKAVVKVAVNW